MSNPQKISSNEGVTSPQHQENDLYPDATAEAVYLDSFYIAALSQSLGYEGFYSSVEDHHNGIEYLFDFYQPNHKLFIKIFHGFDEQQYHLYAAHPSKPILIFDSYTFPCHVDVCECGGQHLLSVDEKMAVHLYDDRQVFIYRDADLWEYVMQINGKWIWRRITPYMVRQLRAEFEQDGDGR